MMEGDGFVVLADTLLDKPYKLLHHAVNPRMDLVVLISRDASAQSATAAPQPPPGMSAAQFALVQRMLARQRGAQTAATAQQQGAPDPVRGPKVALTLYRMGDESSIVWTTTITLEKLLDDGTAEQQHEDLSLQDLVWSPQGDRFAVLVTLRRSSLAGTTIRVASFVKTYSVHDGSLLSTQSVPHVPSAALQDRMTLSWCAIDFQAGPVVSPVELLLRKMRPLPQLPSADTFASSSSQGALMPHQLRMMQMRGMSSPPAFTYPSLLAVQGRGPLAAIPALPNTPTQLGILDSAESRTRDSDDATESLALAPTTAILVSHHQSSQAAILLDGTVNIGTIDFEILSSSPSSSSQTFAVSRDLSSLYNLRLTIQGVSAMHVASLPLAALASYAPACTLRRVSLFSRISHLIRFHLGYVVDSVAALSQTYTRDWVEKVTNEWKKHLADAEQKFGTDIQYELLCVLLTGRAGEAADHLLLANLTEGVLTRLEQQFQTAAYSIKHILAQSTKPGLQRALLCVQDLLGLVRFYEPRLCVEIDSLLLELQSALSSVLRLVRLVDTEAIVAQEFFRWCKVERERQERIKQDQDEPRLAITYDVLTVARYIHRGFDNDAITQILAQTASTPPPAAAEAATPVPPRLSLKQALAQAKDHLTSSESQQPSAIGREKAVETRSVSVLPTLDKVAAGLGRLFHTLLADSLGAAQVETLPLPASTGDLMTESLSAVDSLVSTSQNVDGPAPTCILSRTVTTASETLTATATKGEHYTTIQIHRFPHTAAPTVETVSFDLPSPEHHSDKVQLVDMAFFGSAQLLFLTKHTCTKPQLMSVATETNTSVVRPTRTIQLDIDVEAAACLAVNENKQTVTVLSDDAKRLCYIDVTPLPSQSREEELMHMVQD